MMKNTVMEYPAAEGYAAVSVRDEEERSPKGEDLCAALGRGGPSWQFPGSVML
jgi:hypothetical protein